MIRSIRTLALAIFAAPLASLAAQGAGAPACPVDLLTPQQVGIAYLQRGKVVGAKTPDEASKGIKEAMKGLFDDKAKVNIPGRDYLLAQFYILAAEYGDVQTRGTLGIPGDKAASVDLITGADSLFQMVEKAQPTCAAEIAQWREYKPYQTYVQAAYKAIAANNTDSADKMVRRAQLLSKSGPQTYDVLWRIAQKRGDEAGMVTNLSAAIEKLAADTSNANVRSNFMFNLGRIQQEFGDKKTGADKMAAYKNAAKAYMGVLREYPGSAEAPFAVSAISNLSMIASDTAMGLQAVEAVKAAVGKFNDMALASAGVLATRSGKTADAVTMFEAATKINPYSRDYLYNLAAMMYEAKRSAEMMPVVQRLVAMDPSNSENVMLFAFAFKGLSDNEKDAAAKKKLVDSVATYSKLADDMNAVHKVVYTELDRGAEATTVRGQIENHGKAARSFTLEFELIGKDGAVIGKQSVPVASVAAGGVGDFVLESKIGGVLGVRYAALPLK